MPVSCGHGRPLGGFRDAVAGVREESGRERSELVGGQEVRRLMWAAGLGRGWAEKPVPSHLALGSLHGSAERACPHPGPHPRDGSPALAAYPCPFLVTDA